MNIVLVALGIVVLLAAQGVYYGVLWWSQRQREELRRRLKSLATPGARTLIREGRMARSPRLARFLGQFAVARRLEKLLLQTDIETTVAMLLGSGLALAVALVFGLALLTGGALGLSLIASPIAFAAPILYVVAARESRARKLSSQLADALDMMIRSLRAGHGVSAGFKLVATEMPTPIAVEFGRCFEELQVGGDFREAVRHMTERVPGNLDLRIFATSLIIQHDTGGNLVEILEKIAHTVRERFKFNGKLRALTTEVRVSGYVLGALPFVCALAIALLNPTYLEPLYQDALGRAIALFGLGIWGAGILWMRRLAQVDY